jgi:ferredoxin-NADP reductase/predicted pyridoxine 5'-phosphate oxidase superfamily flavin-nucleotide-binding protein
MDHLSHPAKSPWHAGEKQLQGIYHVAERLEELGHRVIRDYMPDQPREFYQQLPFMVVGAVDANDRPWATVLEGPPGFISSTDPHYLRLSTSLDPQDPATPGLQAGHAIGMLGIELHTRRRNRVNGMIQHASATGFDVAVEQSYGNCPKYIQERAYTRMPEPNAGNALRQDYTALDEQTRAWIRSADTFFIASYVDQGAQRSVDVSHRGGRAGFVKVEGNRLTIPDYAGNLFFNTLGNLHANPVAGLLFIDFASGDLLQLTGRTQLLLDSPLIKAFDGAERLWTFDVEHAVVRPGAVKTRWLFCDYAPTSLATGTWAETDERLRQSEQRRHWQQWKVAGIRQESSDIRSLYLEAPDNAAIAFAPGQHLPVRITTGEDGVLVRTYSISSAPSDGHIRISIKRLGAASRHLHDRVQVGDVLEVRPPLGSFTLTDEITRPVVLMGAGVGITPMISMARELVAQNLREHRQRPIHLFQSARAWQELPFQEELVELEKRSAGLLHIHRALSSPGADSVLARDYQVAGRLSFAEVKARLPLDDYDFYLCGPSGFLQTLYDGLRGVNIPDERIHAEAFGPSALNRSQSQPPPTLLQPQAASGPVPVYFNASAAEARWKPGEGSLLELAERRGLNPEFSCRGGSCGTCSTTLISGEVHYPNPPAQMPAADKVLICCAIPAQPGGTAQALVLDL